MSQSIYGIRIPGTIGDVINQLDGMRPLMRIKASEHIARAIAHIAVDELDRDIIFETGVRKHYLSDAYRQVRQRRRDMVRDQQRDPDVDTDFEVVLRSDGPMVIMMSFTEHMDWFEELLSLPGAEDYSYWDGCDRPDDVSEEDWDQRCKTYSRILSNDPHGRPAGIGVTHAFQPPIGPPELDMIMAAVPTDDARANRLARQLVYSRWIETRAETDLSMSEQFKFISAMDTPEMMDTIQQVKQDIAAKLPAVTPQLLKSGYEPPHNMDPGDQNHYPEI
jgi:hypothetical protein